MTKRLFSAILVLSMAAAALASEATYWESETGATNVKKALDFVLGKSNIVYAVTHDWKIYKRTPANPPTTLVGSWSQVTYTIEAGQAPAAGNENRELDANWRPAVLPLIVFFGDDLYIVRRYLCAGADYGKAPELCVMKINPAGGAAAEVVLQIRGVAAPRKSSTSWVDMEPKYSTVTDGYLFKDTDLKGPGGATLYWAGGGGLNVDPPETGNTFAKKGEPNFSYLYSTGNGTNWTCEDRKRKDQYGSTTERVTRLRIGTGDGVKTVFYAPPLIESAPAPVAELFTGSAYYVDQRHDESKWSTTGITSFTASGRITLAAAPVAGRAVYLTYTHSRAVPAAMPNGYRYNHLVEFAGKLWDHYGYYDTDTNVWGAGITYANGLFTKFTFHPKTDGIHTEPWSRFQMGTDGTRLYRVGFNGKGNQNFLYATTGTGVTWSKTAGPGGAAFEAAPNDGTVYWRGCAVVQNPDGADAMKESAHNGVYATFSRAAGGYLSGVYRYLYNPVDFDGDSTNDLAAFTWQKVVDTHPTTGTTADARLFTGGIFARNCPNPETEEKGGIYVGTADGVLRRSIGKYNGDAKDDGSNVVMNPLPH